MTPAVGNVVVNSTGNTNFDISNTGPEKLDLAINTCSGAGAGTFSFSKSTNINPPFTITLTYAPTARGPRTCSVNVLDNANNATVLGTFNVTGTGVAPVISAPANLSFSAAVRYADSAAVHTASLPLTITNLSTDTSTPVQNLVISNMSLSGTGMGDYTITPPGSNSIAPSSGGNQTGTWTITFDPQALGASSATLTITSNDPLTPTKNVALSGTGGNAIISDTATLNFGTVNQGTSSAAQNIVVSNTAPVLTRAPMNVTLATFANNTAGWFKFTNTGCGGSTTTCALSASLVNLTTNVGVQCAPPAGASGSQTAQVSVTSDADDTTANTTTVMCTAGRADIVVTMTTLAFGDQLINTTSAAQTVMIQNTGNATLSYGVALGGTDASQFTLVGAAGCTSNCSVSANSSVMLTLYFSPSSMGNKSAYVRVTPTNDPDTPGPLDVPMTGRCIAPIASYNVTTMAFGNVEVGAMATAQTLTVTNTGTANLTVSQAYLTAGATEYATTGMTGSSGLTIPPIAPSGSYSWTIACKPTVQGNDPGTFHVTTNSVPPTGQDVALSCTGLKGNLVIVANNFNFGQKIEGSMTTQDFTLTNTGNLAVANIAVTTSGTGTGYSILQPTFPYASLAPGASTTMAVRVQFYPMNGNDGGSYRYTFTGTWGTNNTPSVTNLDLNGDGLTTGYDTTPSNPYPLDFTDIRFDTPTTMPVDVVNTAGTAYHIETLTLTPDANTMTGELQIVNCTHNGVAAVATANGCPTSSTVFFNSTGVSDTMVVNVRCAPANRVGAIGGSLKVHTNLALNPDRTLAIKCNSTTAVLALAPGNTVDFGPIDLDVIPTATTKTITLKNTGVATMNIGTVTKSVNGPFAFGATPPAAIATNGTYSFDVTYTPTVERDPTQPETAQVMLPLAGAIGTPGAVMISISGYGVDRHIALTNVPVFPDTFKNPGDKAPVMPVTIKNNGDANLNVSAVMLSEYPIWSIDNPDMTDVSGRQTYDFNVRFQPITAGKAPTGHMVIYNNDNGKPMVELDFNAYGRDRQVTFGPDINFGYVGIGITTHISDISAAGTGMPFTLGAVNNEVSDPFVVTRIGISGADANAFMALDDNGDPLPQDNTMMLDLSPGTNRTFDIAFQPDHEGDFVANADLYLDRADKPHATVELKGRGLYVDVRGGGGCSTGNGSGGGAMLLVLGALFAARRRRGRGVGFFSVLGVVGAASAAHAETRNLDTALFDPTPQTHVTGLQSSSADVGKDGDYAVSALLTYADNVLVLGTSQNNYNAVDNREVLVVGGAYAFGQRFEAGLRVPMYLQTGQTTGNQMDMFQVVKVDSISRADAVLHAKANGGATEFAGGDLSYGGLFTLSVPTRSGGEFSGANLPQARLLGLATLTKGRAIIQLNAGAIVRSKEVYSSYVQRSGGTFAVGMSYRLADRIWLGGEVFGNVIPGGHIPSAMGATTTPPHEFELPIEGLAEMTFRATRTATLQLALGRGITDGVGTSNVRGALMFAFTPGADDIVPLPKKIHIEGPNDKDGDGVKDKLDACPNEAEDKDLF
ncbi:MAG TPA: choice-of-anchor D domain-containing protein, partial [Kofleriaceae bacterium]|nr:choice-of-anchor D domain-containing protein [Kofleriaceae bacterium]